MNDKATASDAGDNKEETKQDKQKKVTEKLQAMGVMPGGEAEVSKETSKDLSSKLPKISTVIVFVIVFGGIYLWQTYEQKNDQADLASLSKQPVNNGAMRNMPAQMNYGTPYNAYNNHGNVPFNNNQQVQGRNAPTGNNNSNTPASYTNPYNYGNPQYYNNAGQQSAMNQAPVSAQQQYFTMLQQRQSDQRQEQEKQNKLKQEQWVKERQRQDKLMQEQWTHEQKKQNAMRQEQQQKAQQYYEQLRQAQQQQVYYPDQQYGHNWMQNPPPAYYAPQPYQQPPVYQPYYGR